MSPRPDWQNALETRANDLSHARNDPYKSPKNIVMPGRVADLFGDSLVLAVVAVFGRDRAVVFDRYQPVPGIPHILEGFRPVARLRAFGDISRRVVSNGVCRVVDGLAVYCPARWKQSPSRVFRIENHSCWGVPFGESDHL